MNLISFPQYNALVVDERIAWPREGDDYFELAHLLTGHVPEWVEMDEEQCVGACDMDVCIDGIVYHVTYNVSGTYYKQSLYDMGARDLMAVITNVHVIRIKEEVSGTGQD